MITESHGHPHAGVHSRHCTPANFEEPPIGDRLAETVTVVLYDQRGCGGSEVPAETPICMPSERSGGSGCSSAGEFAGEVFLWVVNRCCVVVVLVVGAAAPTAGVWVWGLPAWWYAMCSRDWWGWLWWRVWVVG